MKKNILSIICLALFSIFTPSIAQEPPYKCTQNMLQQISDVNFSWRPVVGQSLYVIEHKPDALIVIRLYDHGKTIDVDPSTTDVQAVFTKTKDGYKLAVIVFSPVDLTKWVSLLVVNNAQ